MKQPQQVEIPPLEHLNDTERLALLRGPAGQFQCVRRELPPERQIQLLETGERAQGDELSGSATCRAKLEKAIGANWNLIQSQLPCKGPNKGKCTVYPCSEGMHYECWEGAKPILVGY